MDEYTYEDCDDIVPSQDLVPSHNNHSNTTDDLDITHPAKRVKTTHEENDPLNQSDTQLSQLPDGVRKIPGPAGSLPPIHPTSVQSFPAKAVVLASQTEENSQEDGLLMQSKIHKKAPSVNSSGGIQQDEYTMDFIRGPWLVMLQNSELPPFGTSPSLLKYSIGHILENRRAKKIPRLVALVKAVVPTDADFKVTLRDPTGEIDGALQRKAIELHPSIVSGAVIVLEQVSVFCPSPVSHYLNIVSKNIAHVYTPSSSELTAAKVQFKRLAVGYSPKSIYDPEPPPDIPSPKKPKPLPPSSRKHPPTPSPSSAKMKSSVWKPSGARNSNSSPSAQRQVKRVANPPSSHSAHPDLPTSGSHNIGEFLVPKSPASTSPRRGNPPASLHNSVHQNTSASSSVDPPLQIESSQRQQSDPREIQSTQLNSSNTPSTNQPDLPPPSSSSQPNAKRPNFFQSMYANKLQPNSQASNLPTNTPTNPPNPPQSNLLNNLPNNAPPNHTPPNHVPLNHSSLNQTTPNIQNSNQMANNQPSNHLPYNIPSNNSQLPSQNSQNHQSDQQLNSSSSSSQNRYQNTQNNNITNNNNNNTQNFSHQYQQNNNSQNNNHQYNQSNQENLQNQHSQYNNRQQNQHKSPTPPRPPKPIPQFSAQSQSTLRNGNTKGNDNMTNFSRDLSGGRRLDSLSTNPSFQTTSLSPITKSSNPSDSSTSNLQTNSTTTNGDGPTLNSSLDDYDLLDCEL